MNFALTFINKMTNVYYRGTSDVQLKKELTQEGLVPYKDKIWLNKEEDINLAKYYARFKADGTLRRRGNPVLIKVKVSKENLGMNGLSGKEAYIVKNNFIPLEDIISLKYL